ncbi:MAG TPA: HAMP domain-containing protein, partial [Firmicutes bacterium]|nr:HAMP domain-containing protein [Bacillota bacterium]
DAVVLANTAAVYEGLNIMKAAGWDENDPAWPAAMAELESILQLAVSQYGYDFIFVTNPEGRVVYGTQQNLFGADLSERDYIKGSLGGKLTWSDFFFSDVVDDYVLLVSIPALSEGETGQIVGTLNLSVGIDIVSDVVHKDLDILGKTADAYLINEDGLLLTNTLQGDYKNGAALVHSLNTRAVELLSGPVASGNLEFRSLEEYQNYTGRTVLGIGEIVKLGNMNAGMVVEIETGEALASLAGMRRATIIVAVLSAILIGVAGYLFVLIGVVIPIARITKLADTSSSGDFTMQVKALRKDEIGHLANAFNTLNASVCKLMSQTYETANNVNQASEALTSSVETTTASIEQVASSAGEFSGSAQELSDSSQEMARISQDVSQKAKEGQVAINNVIEKMRDINKQIDSFRHSLDSSVKRAEEIGKIVGMITDVAGQTNLLALNAAIEAARAGEHGRGFAVVAEEVRKLAEQTARAAEDVAVMVMATQTETKESAQTMGNLVNDVSSGTETVFSFGEIFHDIIAGVENLVARIQDISAAAQELSAGSEEIAASTEEQSAAMEEINASAEELRISAANLIKALSKFKFQE